MANAISTINFPGHGHSIEAELHSPSIPSATGVIAIAYGSDGYTDELTGPWKTMIQGYANSLAEKGFVVLIPNYLAVTQTKPGAEAMEMIFHKKDEWTQALADTIDHAKTLTGIDRSRIGLLGFSLGGYLCLRIRSKAKVLVEFFAPLFDGIGTGGTLSHAQIHHGEEDKGPATGYENALSIKQTLEREHTITELCGYPGAGHGFIGNDPKNSKARELSRQRTLAFFQSHL